MMVIKVNADASQVERFHVIMLYQVPPPVANAPKMILLVSILYALSVGHVLKIVLALLLRMHVLLFVNLFAGNKSRQARKYAVLYLR
jgi:hypothetical protein